MSPPEKDRLVEALVEFMQMLWEEGPLRFPHDVARRFIDQHRLVSLPEEPAGWEASMSEGMDGSCWFVGHMEDLSEEGARRRAKPSGGRPARIRARYHAYGDPIDVTEGEP